ncbi:MAG: hypothetical protein D6819_09970 [Gammaproteobacteria bacterium]|nr:MAG: hypothetical protein D6819_09970 [Gammaproteobacteria bacterium]
MARRSDVFTWRGFLVRFLAALFLVFATYNPEGYSYIHWVMTKPYFSPEKVFAGIALLIGWLIFLRATLLSLGRIGLLLALAFFGTLVWLFISWGWITPNSPKVFIYLSLVILAAVLAIGVSWSFIRRRLTGTIEVDRIDQ